MVSAQQIYRGRQRVGVGESDKSAEAVGFHLGGWHISATELVNRSLLQ